MIKLSFCLVRLPHQLGARRQRHNSLAFIRKIGVCGR